MKHLSHLNSNKLLALIQNCLNLQESQRFDIRSVVSDLYFKTYFKRYAAKIASQSKSQAEKNKKDKREKKMENIPYYKAQK